MYRARLHYCMCMIIFMHTHSQDATVSTHRCNFTAHDFDFYTCTVELSVQTGDVKHFCATRFPGH